MEYSDQIKQIYAFVEADDVSKAVMACLRLARLIQDHFYTACFLNELYPGKKEFASVLFEDTKHLNKSQQDFIFRKSSEIWLESHTVDYAIATGADGEKKNVLAISIAEFDIDVAHWLQWRKDFQIPAGMGEYDTAAFFEEYKKNAAHVGLRLRALNTVKQRVRARCLNYATSVEIQLNNQSNSRGFLDSVQTYVNNYFRTFSEDTYAKLQKSSALVLSANPEDHALLLTEVRRALKSAADHWMKPIDGLVMCEDGKERTFGNDQYLNRLGQYIRQAITKSSSRDFLMAEFELLTVFAKRLNDIASKGVHASVAQDEARQGFLGMYLFFYNVIRRTQEKAGESGS